MAVEQINLHAHRQEALVSQRLLGTLGMLGGPMLLAEGLYRQFTHMPDNYDNQLVGVLGVMYIGGWMCSTVGMRRLRVTGNGATSAAVFVIQLTGLFLAALWSIQAIVHLPGLTESPLFGIADVAWPFSHVLMLVVGMLVLKAKVWRGWLKFVPLLCGAGLPLFFAASAIGARVAGSFLFFSLTAIGFILLGYAVRNSNLSK